MSEFEEAVAGNLTVLTGLVAVLGVGASARAWLSRAFVIASAAPRTVGLLILLAAWYFAGALTVLIPVVPDSLFAAGLVRGAFAASATSLLFGPLLIFTPTRPIKIDPADFFTKVSRGSVSTRRLPIAPLAWIILAVVHAISAGGLYTVLTEGVGIAPATSIGLVIGYGLTAVLYLAVFFGSMTGTNVSIRGVALTDQLRAGLIYRTLETTIAVLQLRFYIIFYALWSVAGAAVAFYILYTGYSELAITLTSIDDMAGLLSLGFGGITAFSFWLLTLRYIAKPVGAGELVLSDGRVIAVQAVKYAAVARSADRTLLVEAAAPDDPHEGLVRADVSKAIAKAPITPGHRTSTIFTDWGRLNQANDHACMYFVATGASYPPSLAFYFAAELHTSVMDVLQGDDPDDFLDRPALSLATSLTPWLQAAFTLFNDTANHSRLLHKAAQSVKAVSKTHKADETAAAAIVHATDALSRLPPLYTTPVGVSSYKDFVSPALPAPPASQEPSKKAKKKLRARLSKLHIERNPHPPPLERIMAAGALYSGVADNVAVFISETVLSPDAMAAADGVCVMLDVTNGATAHALTSRVWPAILRSGVTRAGVVFNKSDVPEAARAISPGSVSSIAASLKNVTASGEISVHKNPAEAVSMVRTILGTSSKSGSKNQILIIVGGSNVGKRSLADVLLKAESPVHRAAPSVPRVLSGQSMLDPVLARLWHLESSRGAPLAWSSSNTGSGLEWKGLPDISTGGVGGVPVQATDNRSAPGPMTLTSSTGMGIAGSSAYTLLPVSSGEVTWEVIVRRLPNTRSGSVSAGSGSSRRPSSAGRVRKGSVSRARKGSIGAPRVGAAPSSHRGSTGTRDVRKGGASTGGEYPSGLRRSTGREAPRWFAVGVMGAKPKPVDHIKPVHTHASSISKTPDAKDMVDTIANLGDSSDVALFASRTDNSTRIDMAKTPDMARRARATKAPAVTPWEPLDASPALGTTSGTIGVDNAGRRVIADKSQEDVMKVWSDGLKVGDVLTLRLDVDDGSLQVARNGHSHGTVARFNTEGLRLSARWWFPIISVFEANVELEVRSERHASFGGAPLIYPNVFSVPSLHPWSRVNMAEAFGVEVLAQDWTVARLVPDEAWCTENSPNPESRQQALGAITTIAGALTSAAPFLTKAMVGRAPLSVQTHITLTDVWMRARRALWHEPWTGAKDSAGGPEDFPAFAQLADRALGVWGGVSSASSASQAYLLIQHDVVEGSAFADWAQRHPSTNPLLVEVANRVEVAFKELADLFLASTLPPGERKKARQVRKERRAGNKLDVSHMGTAYSDPPSSSVGSFATIAAAANKKEAIEEEEDEDDADDDDDSYVLGTAWLKAI